MIVGILELGTFIRNAGIENKWNVVLQKPFYMSVSQFSRITLGLTGDGFNSLFIKLVGGHGGKNNPVL